MTPLPVDSRLALSIHSEVGFRFILQEINTRTWPRFSLILNNVCLLYAFSGKVFKLSGAWVIYQRQMPPSLVLQLPRRAQGVRRRGSSRRRRSIICDETPGESQLAFLFPFSQATWTFPFSPNTSRTWSACTRRWRDGSRSAARRPSWHPAWASYCWLYFCRWASERPQLYTVGTCHELQCPLGRG